MLAGSINPKKWVSLWGFLICSLSFHRLWAALGGVNLAYTLLGEATINTMTFAGIMLFLGAVATLFVQEREFAA